jgi:pimeloyl-ACP methyl ester carboxylesterase
MVEVEIKSEYIRVNNFNIFYRYGGSGEEIVFLHAARSSSRIWLRVMEKLISSFKVYAPDLMGHGESQQLRESDALPDIPEFISKFLDRLEIKNPHLVGASRGGLYAMLFAEKYPNRVRTLTLIDAAGLPEVLRAPKKLRPKSFKELFVNQEIVTDSFIQMYAPITDSIKSEIFEKKWKDALPKDYMTRGFLDSISKVNTPTLIIWGEKDKEIPLVCGYLLNAIIKNSKLVILENIGHSPNLEAPQQVAEIIANFVRGKYEVK